jgi:hypothetical protein
MPGERVQGLLLILAGSASLMLIILAQQSGWLEVQPPLPPGMRPEGVPILTPLSCVLPMAAIGAIGLCFVGLQKLFAPDNWRPPKHLDHVSHETPEVPRPRSSGLSLLLRRLIRRLIER